MKQFWRRYSLWLALAVLLATGSTAMAQDSGTLTGQVLNGTADGAGIGSGLPVTLRVLQGDTEVSLLEASTDQDGRFRFEGLAMDGGLQYWPEVLYLGVPYGPSESLRFGPDETALETSILVYETTDQERAIKLSSVHFIAQSFGQVLRISEIHLFGNIGDRTYVGRPVDSVADRVVTAFLPLPVNAVGLAFEAENAEERFVVVDQGVYDTEPIPPGEEVSLVFFSYHLMSTAEVVQLEREFAYPVDRLSGLVAQPGLDLRSDGLAAMGPQSFQEQQYLLYATEDLPAGTGLVMDFIPGETMTAETASGSLPAGDGEISGAMPRGNQSLLGMFGVGLAILAVLGAVAYPLVTRGLQPARVQASELALSTDASRLLEELADLEEAVGAGTIDEASYERLKAEKVRAIQDLWR